MTVESAHLESLVFQSPLFGTKRRNSVLSIHSPVFQDLCTPISETTLRGRKNSFDFQTLRRLSRPSINGDFASPIGNFKPFSLMVSETFGKTPKLKDLRVKSPFCCSLDRNSPLMTIGTPRLGNSPFTKEPFKNLTHLTRDTFRDRIDLGGIKLTGLLGSGGFGSVYKAQFCGKPVAVKRFHTNKRNFKARFQSFQAESNILHLSHKNVASVLATLNEVSTNETYVIMEFAGHMNLQQVINNTEGGIEQKLRLRYSLDISQALEYIHGQKVLHLDVKPGNIIIGQGDVCKLADFGCCQRLTDGDNLISPTTRSYLTGTVAYRAPELLRGDRPCHKADIYSFGITLWQMMTCEPPFAGENPHVIIFGVVAQNLRPHLPTLDDDDVTEAMYSDWVVQCWDGDKTKRPDAARLVQVFRNLINA